jgi:hypothetical protein
VTEFTQFLKNEVNRQQHTIIRDILHNNLNIVDQSVYKKSQQYRALGSTKKGQNRPLSLVRDVISQFSGSTRCKNDPSCECSTTPKNSIEKEEQWN